MKDYRYAKTKQHVLKAISAVITFVLAAACHGILREQGLDAYTAKGVSLVLGYVIWQVSTKNLGIHESIPVSGDAESVREGYRQLR